MHNVVFKSQGDWNFLNEFATLLRLQNAHCCLLIHKVIAELELEKGCCLYVFVRQFRPWWQAQAYLCIVIFYFVCWISLSLPFVLHNNLNKDFLSLCTQYLLFQLCVLLILAPRDCTNYPQWKKGIVHSNKDDFIMKWRFDAAKIIVDVIYLLFSLHWVMEIMLSG